MSSVWWKDLLNKTPEIGQDKPSTVVDGRIKLPVYETDPVNPEEGEIWIVNGLQTFISRKPVFATQPQVTTSNEDSFTVEFRVSNPENENLEFFIAIDGKRNLSFIPESLGDGNYRYRHFITPGNYKCTVKVSDGINALVSSNNISVSMVAGVTINETFTGANGSALPSKYNVRLVGATATGTLADIYDNRLRTRLGSSDGTASAVQVENTVDKFNFTSQNILEWNFPLSEGLKNLYNAIELLPDLNTGSTNLQSNRFLVSATISSKLINDVATPIIKVQVHKKVSGVSTTDIVNVDIPITQADINNKVVQNFKLTLSQSAFDLKHNNVSIGAVASDLGLTFNEAYITVKTTTGVVTNNTLYDVFADDIKFTNPV